MKKYCNACDEHPRDPKSAKGYCHFCQEVEDSAAREFDKSGKPK